MKEKNHNSVDMASPKPECENDATSPSWTDGTSRTFTNFKFFVYPL